MLNASPAPGPKKKALLRASRQRPSTLCALRYAMSEAKDVPLAHAVGQAFPELRGLIAQIFPATEKGCAAAKS